VEEEVGDGRRRRRRKQGTGGGGGGGGGRGGCAVEEAGAGTEEERWPAQWRQRRGWAGGRPGQRRRRVDAEVGRNRMDKVGARSRWGLRSGLGWFDGLSIQL
jgi:hypothetical protein